MVWTETAIAVREVAASRYWSHAVLVSAALLAGGSLGAALPADAQDSRSTKLNDRPEAAGEVGFDSAQSVAILIGVRRFTHDETFAVVPFAVDDAVDLAFALSIGGQSRLVKPGRVHLVLGGEPQKASSRQRLDGLLAAGATRHAAGHSDILHLLDERTQRVGREGLLIVGVASHGFTDAESGEHYLAASNSLLRHPETALRTQKILDQVSRSPAQRRLVFLDACRERLTLETRSARPDHRSSVSAGLVDAIEQAQGEAILLAARRGSYAFDDMARQNGVFTAAVVDALNCAAATDDRGFVTLDTLADFVEHRVTEWRQHRYGASSDQGIQVNLGGTRMRSLPLASCTVGLSPATQPAIARTLDRYVNVFNDEGVRLWGVEVGGRVGQAQVADLNGDGKNEVVIGIDTNVGRDNEETGHVVVVGATGERLWSRDTWAPYVYAGGHGDRFTIRALAVGGLFKTGELQIVALSADSQAWYQARLTIWGSRGDLLASYWHPGHLSQVRIIEMPGGKPGLVVDGLNNDLRGVFGGESPIPVVFMLDPSEVSGEAPPYRGSAGRGPHTWYGMVSPPEHRVIRIDVLDRDNDGRPDLGIWTQTAHVFYLDADGHLMAKASGDGATGSAQWSLIRERDQSP